MEYNTPMRVQLFSDSIDPCVDASVVEFVDTNHRVTQGITLVPSPGHTPGHVSVLLESEGEKGLVSGDFIHHPVQLTHSEWSSIFDAAPDVSIKTRQAMFKKLHQENITVFATAFPSPSVGKIIKRNDNYTFEAL
jgi:glyoxylase-like metal-dependent hydrolase (beta-lactamase superfamily II)